MDRNSNPILYASKSPHTVSTLLSQYVTVTLKVDNPSSNGFNAYWGDYIRLKSGDTTSAPTTDSTLPIGFPAGSSGMKGDLTFLMPQGNATYTLILLQVPSTGASQSTVNFQVG